LLKEKNDFGLGLIFFLILGKIFKNKIMVEGIVKIFRSVSPAKFLIILGVFTFTIFCAQNVSAEEETSFSVSNKKFNLGKFVMEDVSDAFEWNIATLGKTKISIPLPIILHSKTTGWNLFWSSKFKHGTAEYKNFKIAKDGDNDGKIIELNTSGEVTDLPLNLSITKTVAGIFVNVLLLFWIFLTVAKSAKRNKGKAPKGLQNIMEPVILFVRDEVAKSTIGEKKYEKYLPFLLTMFFFILISNLTGLIPIFPLGANVTGNIAVTLVLALFTFVLTTFSGNKHYWKDIYNPDVPWWLKFPIPLMPIVELTGVFTKPFVLMIRLFANMLAGHMIIAVFISLIFFFASSMGNIAGYGVSFLSVFFSVFMTLLDILVSFIQAYVFTLLSALYFGMATEENHS